MDWAAEGPQIKRFLNRSGVPFRLIGGTVNQAQAQLGLNPSQVNAAGWIPSVEDYWRAIDYDIGVIPLKPHVFNQSKSHLKFLENAALGIPTVASDAGPYSASIEHGKTGFLVKRDHEWSKYLRDLVNDEAMREEIGANAKEWAKTQILEDHIDEWAKVLFE
jgi:glycosyltransferase involved in cell wall biosynthesis